MGSVAVPGIPRKVEDIPVHKVVIKNKQFQPSHLKVEEGSIVQWLVHKDSIESNESSLYYHDGRSHVISFRTINEES